MNTIQIVKRLQGPSRVITLSIWPPFNESISSHYGRVHHHHHNHKPKSNAVLVLRVRVWAVLFGGRRRFDSNKPRLTRVTARRPLAKTPFAGPALQESPVSHGIYIYIAPMHTYKK